MTFPNIYGTASFWTKIFITLCIMLIMLIISAILIWLFSTGFSNILSQSDILVGSMSIQCIFLFISTAVVTAGLFSSRPFSYLKMDKKPTVTALIGVIICMIVFVPFMNLVISWNQSLSLPEKFSAIETWMRNKEASAQLITDQLLNVHSLGALVLLIFVIGILTGIGEEALFRGLLQKLLWEKTGNKHAAIWIGAIIFSAVHFQFFGFIPRMLLGAFFGYLLVWSGNIWLPITAHFFNNSITVVFHYIENQGYELSYFEKLGTIENGTWDIAIYSLILFILCSYTLYKYLQKKSLRI